MWKNAGDTLIQLDVTCTPSDIPRHDADIPTLSILKDLLGRSPGKARSVRLYCRAQSLLSVMETGMKHLETLVAMENNPGRRFRASSQLLGGQPRNLRRLELAGVTVPWTSPIITPQLTHLLVDINPTAVTAGTIADLVSLLRLFDRLKAFKVYLDYPVADEEMEFYLSSAGNRTPIHLPVLEVLDIHSSHRGPLGAILSLIHIPKDISRLAVTSGNIDGHSAERVLDFATCGRSREYFITPEEVEIDYHSAACWKRQRFQWVNKDSRGPRHPDFRGKN
ncbi:hypothetical protein FA13DRAFT_890158 [Coprinellus micaceus]|uniref:F-box domain-containing protein n=1 Tax=Coprinellus micaceus TaxID=71717 RepID=A0A4Y7TSI0_COPMI|nr:hypothetical protein FA13DRAFT_890158 [Coprinellus micaceus]